jgi:hypothetical protein
MWVIIGLAGKIYMIPWLLPSNIRNIEAFRKSMGLKRFGDRMG